MTGVPTFTQFLTEVKQEAKLNDTSEDVTILDMLNEITTEVIANTQDLRPFQFTTGQVLSGAQCTLDDMLIRSFDRVQYTVDGGDPNYPNATWDLFPFGGLVRPAPFDGYPNSYYTEVLAGTDVTKNKYQIAVTPAESSAAGTLSFNLTGFRFITTGADYIRWVSVIPYIKRTILQRLQIKRNLEPDKVKLWDDSIKKAAAAAAMGESDTVTDETQNQNQK